MIGDWIAACQPNDSSDALRSGSGLQGASQELATIEHGSSSVHAPTKRSRPRSERDG
jgi:hypothetical protein